MGKTKLTTIVTSICPQCKYCTLQQESKAVIKISCSAHDKVYNYGQRIECEYFEKQDNKQQDNK